MKPPCIDLYAGLGGWAEGFLAEGYDVVGFDIERHDYGTGGYPAQLVLQNVTTIHGSQFRNAAVIVASPPCPEYSYMAMPWSRAKQIAAALREEITDFPEGYTGSRTITELTALFGTCFRIQREACEAAGRFIPMVVENVRGAQPWVGKAKANFGSYYLWGDVDMVGRRIVVAKVAFGNGVSAKRSVKIGGGVGDDWFTHHNRDEFLNRAVKNSGGSWFGERDGKPLERNDPRDMRRNTDGDWTAMGHNHPGKALDGIKQGGDRFGKSENMSISRMHSSRRTARKAASAQIAKIPFELSSYIARAFKPAVIASTVQGVGSVEVKES